MFRVLPFQECVGSLESDWRKCSEGLPNGRYSYYLWERLSLGDADTPRCEEVLQICLGLLFGHARYLLGGDLLLSSAIETRRVDIVFQEKGLTGGTLLLRAVEIYEEYCLIAGHAQQIGKIAYNANVSWLCDRTIPLAGHFFSIFGTDYVYPDGE